MEINLDEAIYAYKKLVNDARLTKAEREEHLKNVGGFQQLVNEWKKLKQNQE